jgi:hypothetical protein
MFTSCGQTVAMMTGLAIHAEDLTDVIGWTPRI